MSETIPQMPWLSDKHVEDILKHIHGADAE
jgi:hypothetical protein